MSALVLVALGACSPYSPELGSAPYLCASSEPRCPEGYSCQTLGTQNVCVDSTGVTPTPDSRPLADAPVGDAPLADAPPADAPPSGTCLAPFTGVLASWTLTNQNGSQTASPADTSTTGVVAGDLKRGGSLTPSTGSGSMNSSGWSTGALDKSKYYTVTITAPNGCALDATSLSLDASSSGTGPTSAAVGTSADTFATTKPGSTTGPSTVTLTGTSTTSMLEIRIYGVGASATTGTMRIKNTLSVTGTLQ